MPRQNSSYRFFSTFRSVFDTPTERHARLRLLHGQRPTTKTAAEAGSCPRILRGMPTVRTTSALDDSCSSLARLKLRCDRKARATVVCDEYGVLRGDVGWLSSYRSPAIRAPNVGARRLVQMVRLLIYTPESRS